MTTIGYATLQIIPSLRGVSEAIDKQLRGTSLGQNAGRQIGGNIAAGVRGSEPQISAALTQAVNRRGGEKAGKDWADSTATAMAQHLQSAQNSQKLQSSLTYLVKNGDAAGKKFARDMASNLAIELPVQTRAQQVGEKVGAVIGRSIGLGIKAAGVAGVAAIGYTLTKGFQRLESIDRATFKLKALGHSADETKTIMDNALASVKGTAFSLADAATAAASAVAAGIQPGKDLTKYLSEVGDAAAVAGTSFEDMGSIFNKIQTSNKAYTDDLQQLSDRGLPIFQWLQKEYGVTADKLSEMVQKGEVDSAHFQKAINDNIGGAAQKMGQSFDGAVQNLEASVARVGANFLTAILGGPGGSALEGPTEAVGRLTEKFDQISAWVQLHAPEIRQFFVDMVNDVKPVVEALGNIGGFLVSHPALIEAVVIAFAGWKAITVISAVATGVKEIATALGLVGPAAAAAGTATAAGLTPILGVLSKINPLLSALGAYELGKSNPFSNPDIPGSPAAKAQQVLDDAKNHGGQVDPHALDPNWQPRPVPPPPKPHSAYADIYPYQGRAAGGPLMANGPKGKDSALFWGARGEHVLTAPDVDAMGGQGGVYAFRRMLHRQGGGRLDPFTGLIVQPDPVPVGPQSPKVDPRPGHNPAPGDNPREIGIPDWEKGTFGAPPGDWWRKPINPDDILFPDFVGPGQKERQKKIWERLHPRVKLFGFQKGGAIGGGTGITSQEQQTMWDAIHAAFPKALLTSATRTNQTEGHPDFHNAGRAIDIGGPSMDQIAAWIAQNYPDSLELIHAPFGHNIKNGKDVGDGLGLYGAHTMSGHHDHVHWALGHNARGDTTADKTYADKPSAQPPTRSAAPAPEPAAPDEGPTSGSDGSSLPSSLSGLSSWGLDDLGSGLGKTKSGSDLSLFGKAAGAAVSGQVSSALGVLGVGDSPGWLQAATKLIGGIKVGDGNGNTIFDGSHPLSFGQGRATSSAAPLSATPTITGAPPPDDAGNMHGGRAGGPQTVNNWHIRTATVEDAFVRAQRIEREKAAAKLDRY